MKGCPGPTQSLTYMETKRAAIVKTHPEVNRDFYNPHHHPYRVQVTRYENELLHCL